VASETEVVTRATEEFVCGLERGGIVKSGVYANESLFISSAVSGFRKERKPNATWLGSEASGCGAVGGATKRLSSSALVGQRGSTKYK